MYGAQRKYKNILKETTDVCGHLFCILVAAVEYVLEVIHPNFCQPHLVAGDDLRALGESVGALGAEDMAHHRARNDLQLTSTLPYLRNSGVGRHFKSLHGSTPTSNTCC